VAAKETKKAARAALHDLMRVVDSSGFDEHAARARIACVCFAAESKKSKDIQQNS